MIHIRNNQRPVIVQGIRVVHFLKGTAVQHLGQGVMGSGVGKNLLFPGVLLQQAVVGFRHVADLIAAADGNFFPPVQVFDAVLDGTDNQQVISDQCQDQDYQDHI